MSRERRRRVVLSLEEVNKNIGVYARAVAGYPALASRIRHHPAWYATRDETGHWIFGPSKFVGYHGANAKDYLAGYSRKDGKETEPALSEWFAQVDLETALGRELREAFVKFAEGFARTPNARWRVSVSRDELAARGLGRNGPRKDWASRIAFDPEIAGGRARIAGTRVRVPILSWPWRRVHQSRKFCDDFPYLSQDDISAALSYAAGAVDHRVLQAA